VSEKEFQGRSRDGWPRKKSKGKGRVWGMSAQKTPRKVLFFQHRNTTNATSRQPFNPEPAFVSSMVPYLTLWQSQAPTRERQGNSHPTVFPRGVFEGILSI